LRNEIFESLEAGPGSATEEVVGGVGKGVPEEFKELEKGPASAKEETVTKTKPPSRKKVVSQ